MSAPFVGAFEVGNYQYIQFSSNKQLVAPLLQTGANLSGCGKAQLASLAWTEAPFGDDFSIKIYELFRNVQKAIKLIYLGDTDGLTTNG